MYKFLKNKILRNEEGSGLILALMTFVVLIGLGTTIATITMSTYKMSDINRDSSSAYYIAEAGANKAYEEMYKIVNDTYESSSSKEQFYSNLDEEMIDKNGNKFREYSFSEQFGKLPEAIVTIDFIEDSEARKYTLESRANIGNHVRVAEKEVTVNWVDKKKNKVYPVPSLPHQSVIIFKNTLKFTSHSGLTGNIHHEVGGKITGSFHQNGRGPNKPINVESIEWDKYYGLVESYTEIPGDTEEKTYDGSGNLILTKDTFIPNLTINRNLTINTQGKILNLVVNKLTLNDKNINFSGNGKVNIYVTNDLIFTGQNNKVNGKLNQINILYFGTEDLDMNNGFYTEGSIFINESNLKISKNVTVKGALITGGELVEYGRPGDNASLATIMYAPRALVKIRQGTLNGKILADSFEIHGNNINGSNLSVEEYPFGKPVESVPNNIDVGDVIIPESTIESR